jgi:hypothetical protein
MAEVRFGTVEVMLSAPPVPAKEPIVPSDNKSSPPIQAIDALAALRVAKQRFNRVRAH